MVVVWLIPLLTLGLFFSSSRRVYAFNTWSGSHRSFLFSRARSICGSPSVVRFSFLSSTIRSLADFPGLLPSPIREISPGSHGRCCPGSCSSSDQSPFGAKRLTVNSICLCSDREVARRKRRSSGLRKNLLWQELVDNSPSNRLVFPA